MRTPDQYWNVARMYVNGIPSLDMATIVPDGRVMHHAKRGPFGIEISGPFEFLAVSEYMLQEDKWPLII